MSSVVSRTLRAALICTIGTLLVAGCGKQNDLVPVAQAEKK